MPASSNSSSQKDSSSTDFVLKHRVTGAAVILIFGALVLPWLLGAPSEAKKDTNAQLVAKNNQELAINQALREELLASLEDQQELPINQVYVSKITPLSKSNDSLPNTALQQAEQPTKKTPLPATRRVAKEVPPVQPKSDTGKTASAKLETVSKTVEKVRTDPVTSPAVVQPASKPVTVGWVVQVGVFTDKNGVEKVIKDLKSKGFNPSTTIVETNKGKGTRIWLGPYSERVQAAQMISTLSDKTGESGFIRAYP